MQGNVKSIVQKFDSLECQEVYVELNSMLGIFKQIDKESRKAFDESEEGSLDVGRLIQDVKKKDKITVSKGLGYAGCELLASAVKLKTSKVSKRHK